MENISNFEDRKIVFAIYRDKLSNEATAVLKHEKIAHKTMSTKIGCYENWSDIAHRTDIIDIYYGPKGGVKLNGIYQTLGRNGIKKFKYNDGETGAITLCLKANSIEGFIITKEFESAIKRNIAELWEFNRNDVSGNIIPLSDGLRILQENL